MKYSTRAKFKRCSFCIDSTLNEGFFGYTAIGIISPDFGDRFPAVCRGKIPARLDENSSGLDLRLVKDLIAQIESGEYELLPT